MSHNYGDGGFWFTQPVGNGYSGAHSFGGVAMAKPSYLSGPPSASVMQSGPSLASAMQSSLTMKSVSMLQQRQRMVESRLAAAVAQLEALPAGTHPKTRDGLENDIYKLQQKLAALTSEIEALSVAEAQGRGTLGPQASPSTTSTPLMPSYMEGEGPGSDRFDARGDFDFSVEDGMVVSEDVEEPSGVMAWVEDNKLLAAGLGAVVGYFGYRHGKNKGWF